MGAIVKRGTSVSGAWFTPSAREAVPYELYEKRPNENGKNYYLLTKKQQVPARSYPLPHMTKTLFQGAILLMMRFAAGYQTFL